MLVKGAMNSRFSFAIYCLEERKMGKIKYDLFHPSFYPDLHDWFDFWTVDYLQILCAIVCAKDITSICIASIIYPESYFVWRSLQALC